MALLQEAGFVLDSSASAFRGCPPEVSVVGPLARVPVSASPRPVIRRRFGVPTWARYRLLNLATLLFLPAGDLLDLIHEIFAAQATSSIGPHLVVLAHPWEFADVGSPGCGVANYQRLLDRVDFLSAHFDLDVVPLRDLAQRALIHAA